jgi:hypothetical protein
VKKGDPGWIPVQTLNTIPYTQEILAGLRKGPIVKSDFTHIKSLHDKISTLRKLLPQGYIITGHYIWTKGKFGTYREYQYHLTTPSPVLRQDGSSTLSATPVV